MKRGGVPHKKPKLLKFIIYGRVKRGKPSINCASNNYNNAVESISPSLDESTPTLMLSWIFFFGLPESMTQTHLIYRDPMLIIQILRGALAFINEEVQCMAMLG